MKVLVSSIIFPNSKDENRGIYIYKKIIALAKMCEVRVVAPVPFVPVLFRRSGYGRYIDIPAVEYLGGLEVHHPRYIVTPKVGRALHGVLFFLSLFSYMRKQIQIFSPDIILCYWAYPDGFANALLSKILHVPIVIGCLGSDINLHTKYFLRRTQIAWSLKHAGKILVVSDAMRRQVHELVIENTKIKVIPNGVDTANFYPMDQRWARKRLGLDPCPKIILYVGRLSEEKGLTTLIEAFSKLPYRQDRLLVIVGSGDMQARCQALVMTLCLNQYVIFVGERPHHEIPFWVNASDVICLPSFREGWPNVVMEALACGKPVVASNVGGVPEILTSEALGILSEPGDPIDLAEKLSKATTSCWNEEILRNRINSRSWDVVAQNMYEELQQCLIRQG